MTKEPTNTRATPRAAAPSGGGNPCPLPIRDGSLTAASMALSRVVTRLDDLACSLSDRLSTVMSKPRPQDDPIYKELLGDFDPACAAADELLTTARRLVVIIQRLGDMAERLEL